MDSTPSDTGFLGSPRNQRRLMWGSGAVLLVGVVVFFTTVVFKGSSGIKSPISTVKAQSAPKQIKAKPDPKAFKVAREFLQTAVQRKDLDTAYTLVNREIKGDQTRKQWDTGNIAVIKYPAGNTKTAAFTVVWSYKTQMMTIVDLVAAKGTHLRPHIPFWLGLVREHNKPNGHWLVNYFEADYTPPVRSGS